MSLSAYAQNVNMEYKYWVKFKDKNNSTFSIYDPAAFLSQKSIDRRAKYGISVEEQDLPVNQQYIDELVSWKEGITVLHSSKWFNAVAIQFEDSTKSFLTGIENLAFFEDTVLLATALKEGDDKPFFTDKYDLELEAESIEEFEDSEAQLDFMNGLILHDNEFKGQGMLIAVIDNGFRNVDTLSAYKHLYDENHVIATKDFVELDGDVYNNSSTHGTTILSTCAANLPGEYIGAAPLADYIFLISEAPGEQRIEEVNWVVAAEFADSCGADIANTSLGYSDFDGEIFDYEKSDMDGETTIIAQAGNIAATKGMLLVTSAGNAGNSEWGIITSPGDAPGMFTVGGVQSDSTMYAGSSNGPTADLRIKPDVVAPGFGVTYISRTGLIRYNGNGTSYAAPIIAGLAACLWQTNPEKSPEEVKQAIRESGNLAAQPNFERGYGIPDFNLAYELLNGSSLTTGLLNVSDKSEFPSHLNNNQLTYFAEKTASIKVKLLSNNGKILGQQTFFAIGGQYNTFNLNLNSLSNGLYILCIEDGLSGKEILKFIR